MVGTVLITNGDENGGVHPPLKLAGVYVKNIVAMFEVGWHRGPDGQFRSREVAEAKHAEVVAFEAKVVGILAKYHADLQEQTRDEIVDGTVFTDIKDHVSYAIEDIVAAGEDLSFAAALRSPAVQEHLTTELTRMFATTVHAEHSHHADRIAGRVPPEHTALFSKYTNQKAIHPAFVEQAKGR